MQDAVQTREDIQEEALFEGLLFWVPGARNNLADLCSRADDVVFHAGLSQLLKDASDSITLCRVPPVWTLGRVDIASVLSDV